MTAHTCFEDDRRFSLSSEDVGVVRVVFILNQEVPI
mgnify:CR=1 FL=1